MQRVRYTRHLELRLKLRGIPYNLPRTIYRISQERYFDRGTGKTIAVRQVKHKQKLREFALIYEEDQYEASLISIHPLKIYQKLNRIKSGRWQLL